MVLASVESREWTREDKSSGLRAAFHSEFLASRCFSDISDYAPLLELLAMGKGGERSWMDDVGAGTERFQFPRSLSPSFYFPRTAGAL